MKKQKKQIRIECSVNDFLRFEDLVDFQGRLKKRDAKDVERIVTSIKKYGFSFPFFVWKADGRNYCLDGHGRMLAIKELLSQGYEIDSVPVVFIEAKDRGEAKQKLLRLNSQYGKIDKEGYDVFTNGIEINIDEIDIGLDLDEIDIASVEEEQEVICQSYKKVHVLLSFPPGKYQEIQGLLEQIRDIEGVEYEQSAN